MAERMVMRTKSLRQGIAIFATLICLSLGGKALAHEFWIDPEAFFIAPGENLVANLRNGEEFEGVSMSYVPRRFERFEIIQNGTVAEVTGRIGDRPALDQAITGDGLAIVVHETTERRISWREWDRFAGFVEHKDLGDIVAMQAARGLDQDNVREGFIRYAKSLVAVGSGDGADARVGLRTEIVALDNPYAMSADAPLRVQAWLDDAPRPDVQVELFAMAPGGTVEVTLHRTDDDGIATLPVAPGHRYLVDAVAMEPVEPVASDDPEWRTLWASLTFQMPE